MKVSANSVCQVLPGINLGKFAIHDRVPVRVNVDLRDNGRAA
jgi:hypothetical protein